MLSPFSSFGLSLPFIIVSLPGVSSYLFTGFPTGPYEAFIYLDYIGGLPGGGTELLLFDVGAVSCFFSPDPPNFSIRFFTLSVGSWLISSWLRLVLEVSTSFSSKIGASPLSAEFVYPKLLGKGSFFFVFSENRASTSQSSSSSILSSVGNLEISRGRGSFANVPLYSSSGSSGTELSILFRWKLLSLSNGPFTCSSSS